MTERAHSLFAGAVVLSILPVAVAAQDQLAGGVGEPCEALARTQAAETPTGLTHEDWEQIRRTIQESEYHVARLANADTGPVFVASNRQQGYSTTFRREGIQILPQAQPGGLWHLNLSVTGWGYEGEIRPLLQAEPEGSKERVEYRRGPVTEWYANRPGGLEQGFELREPPWRGEGPLVLEMTWRGALAVIARGGDVAFADAAGKTLVRYASARAWDASGRPLPVRLEATDRQVRLLVEAQAARFPVNVDPTFINEAQLFGHADPLAGEAGENFSQSVSVYGETLAVGAPGSDVAGAADAGAVYVFLRSGAGWAVRGKLTASDGAAGDKFGQSVSVSAIGSEEWGEIIAVGAPGGDVAGLTDAGAVYLFTGLGPAGTGWAQQPKLTASDGAAGDGFGSSVSVSGTYVVVGAYRGDTPAGADAGSVYVFDWLSTGWAERQKLTASDGAAGDRFGYSVSGYGSDVVVGAPMDSNARGLHAGAVYVFGRPGTTWAQQQKLTAADGAAGDTFGFSVSRWRETLLVGAPLHDAGGLTDAGAAYVFARSGTSWAQQQKLTAADGAVRDEFGLSVSISCPIGFVPPEPCRAVVGAHKDDTAAAADAGSAYVFVSSGTGWTQQQKLTAADGAASDRFGYAVSVACPSFYGGGKRAVRPSHAERLSGPLSTTLPPERMRARRTSPSSGAGPGDSSRSSPRRT